MIFDLIKIGLTALVSSILSAWLSGYLITRWKSREDAIEKRLDEVCAEVANAAALAAEYWQRPPNAEGVKMLGVKTQSVIFRISGLRSLLGPLVSRPASGEMEQAESQFLRTCTGGDFGVHNREADLERAMDVLRSASYFTVVVRRARMSDVVGWRRRR